MLISKLGDVVGAKEKKKMCVLMNCKFSPKFKQIHKTTVNKGAKPE